ncbi:hypothetical protein TMU3MR103_1203 [Tetragenococcus muriaticus 3MR10-3]|uniref:Uncharacterized protein n=1 Tax=Tetragenococcus muriaticus 3MR10-3 TaxID=1302648 RepID=A0A091C4K4_9ENTE|nr:hypothetical protein TMU3MR103_1203 [Tetragenococcus muriaticus 3MR10-3]
MKIKKIVDFSFPILGSISIQFGAIIMIKTTQIQLNNFYFSYFR